MPDKIVEQLEALNKKIEESSSPKSKWTDNIIAQVLSVAIVLLGIGAMMWRNQAVSTTRMEFMGDRIAEQGGELDQVRQDVEELKDLQRDATTSLQQLENKVDTLIEATR